MLRLAHRLVSLDRFRGITEGRFKWTDGNPNHRPSSNATRPPECRDVGGPGMRYCELMATLVLTAIGDDHAGLVGALSGVVADHGGNWEKSRMAHLAGKFAGIVMVTIAEENAEALIRDLEPLQARGLLDITATLSTPIQPTVELTRLTLELVGLDQPGILRDISDALSIRRVSIEELETETSSAPLDGGMLFKARAVLVLPDDVSAETLTDVLEDLAHQLMVDIELNEADAG